MHHSKHFPLLIVAWLHLLFQATPASATSTISSLSSSSSFASSTASATPTRSSTGSPATLSWPVKTFLSEPDLHPLAVQITYNTTATTRHKKHRHHVSPDYLFLAPDGSQARSNGGPLIVDESGDEIYIGPAGHAFNFGPQTYKGKTVLTWWDGQIFPEPVGRGYGNIIIADESYKVIANVSLPGNFATLKPGETFPSNIDLHEVVITKQGTVVVTGNNVTTTDLTSVGGPEKGWVVDAQVYEIDIETNEVLFHWNGLDHLDQIPVTASVDPIGSEGFGGKNQSTAWGYFHINSAHPFEDGYILSSRYLSSVIAIGKDGHVKWRLQGQTGGDFTLAPDAHFSFQHQARPISTHGDSELIFSIHDNANSPLTEPNPTTPSSGLVLRVNTKTHTASKVARYVDLTNPIIASAQGSFQSLSNGNVLLGHGFTPSIQEFAHDGTILATTQFGPIVNGQGDPLGGVLSYRAFKGQWRGCPTKRPAVAVRRVQEGNRLQVAMSWNGATGVENWVVLAGDVAGERLEEKRTVRKKGFETVVEIEDAAFVRVQARGRMLSRGGESLSASEVVDVREVCDL